MKLDKNTIKESFSRAASTYDSNALFQREVVDELVCWLGNFNPSAYACSASGEGLKAHAEDLRQSILDIGCGTGRLMGSIKWVHPESRVYGCDLALPMLLKARENLGVSRLTASDCEALPFADASFDMVLSSLTYQWSEELLTAFREAGRVLKPGGLFIFSTLGPKTLFELRTSYKETLLKGTPEMMEFKDIDELSSTIKKARLDIAGIEGRMRMRRYENLRELLRTLKSIGASPPLNPNKEGLSMGAVLKEAEKVYNDRFPAPDRGIIATYEVIFAAARKG